MAFDVGVCARYQTWPKLSHVAHVKRIIRYVGGETDIGLCYTRDTTSCIIGYSDADLARNAEEMKSPFEGCLFFGNNLVFWFTKKQSGISLSTAKAKYIAPGRSAQQIIWMKHMPNGLI